MPRTLYRRLYDVGLGSLRPGVAGRDGLARRRAARVHCAVAVARRVFHWEHAGSSVVTVTVVTVTVTTALPVWQTPVPNNDLTRPCGGRYYRR